MRSLHPILVPCSLSALFARDTCIRRNSSKSGADCFKGIDSTTFCTAFCLLKWQDVVTVKDQYSFWGAMQELTTANERRLFRELQAANSTVQEQVQLTLVKSGILFTILRMCYPMRGATCRTCIRH